MNNGRSRFRSRLANLVSGRNSPREEDFDDSNEYTTIEPGFVIHRSSDNVSTATSNSRGNDDNVLPRTTEKPSPTAVNDKTEGQKMYDTHGPSAVAAAAADKSYELTQEVLKNPSKEQSQDETSSLSLSIPTKGDISVSSTDDTVDGTKKTVPTTTTSTTTLKPRSKYRTSTSSTNIKSSRGSFAESLEFPTSYEPLGGIRDSSLKTMPEESDFEKNATTPPSTKVKASLNVTSSTSFGLDENTKSLQHDKIISSDVDNVEQGTRSNDKMSMHLPSTDERKITEGGNVIVVEPQNMSVKKENSMNLSSLVTPIKTTFTSMSLVDRSTTSDSKSNRKGDGGAVDISIDSAPSFTNASYSELTTTPDPLLSPTRGRSKKLDLFVQKANAKLEQRQEMIDLLSKETNDQSDEIQFLQRQIEEAQTTLDNERVGAQNQLKNIFRNLIIFEDDKENNTDSCGEDDDNNIGGDDTIQQYHMASRGGNNNINDNNENNNNDDGLICLDSEYVKRLYTQVYRSFVMRQRLETQLLFVKGLCDENVQTLRDSLTQTEQQASKEQQEMLSELSSAAEMKAKLELNSNERLDKVNHQLSEIEEELAKENTLSKRLSKQHQRLETSKAHLEMDLMNQLTTLSAAKASMEDDYEEQLEHTTHVLESLQEELETIKYNYRSSGLFDDYMPQWDDGTTGTSLDDNDNEGNNTTTTLFWNDSNIKAAAVPTQSFDAGEDNDDDLKGTYDNSDKKKKDVFRINNTISPTRSTSSSRTPQRSNLRDIDENDVYAHERQQDLLWRRTQRDVHLANDMLQLLKTVDGNDGNVKDIDTRTSQNECSTTEQGTTDECKGHVDMQGFSQKARQQYLNNILLVVAKAKCRLELDESIDLTKLDDDDDDDTDLINKHEQLSVNVVKRIATFLEALEEMETNGTLSNERKMSLCNVFAPLYAQIT